MPVSMPLHRPTALTDRRLIVVDNLSEQWVMGFSVHHHGQLYRITGFYPK
ncbi:hypothetical protein H8N01_30435 [Streptomyces sp. AC536]|nr:hypothetical protein [Streptomyces buecherae]MBC3986785.1 hypothetical protein [Streptomyces buecherae]QNJ38980.1 hypothetical protein H7H31_02910 [Streptomyces buecherae]